MDKKSLELTVAYDSRFNGLMFQGKVGDDIFPPNVIGLRSILAKVPAHEVEAALMDEYQDTEPGGVGIDPARIRMLEETDWKDKVVLDIGGYDGFAAEIAHKGGAKRAIVLDSEQWRHYGWPEVRKEGVEYVKGDYMNFELDDCEIHSIQGKHGDPYRRLSQPDTLIYFNILYHVWNPVAALKHLRSLIKPGGEMLLCTLFRYHPGSWAYFYNARECNSEDESVFWGPSLECLEKWLENTGWEAERYALAYDRVLYRCKATLEPQYRQSEY